jgi:beta-phosphoglucomutase
MFDLDGVIIKSMEQHLQAWRYAFNSHGIKVKKHDFYMLEGRGVKAVVHDLTERYGLDLKLAPSIMQAKIDYYNRNYKAEFYDGLFELLSYLDENGIRMAIVTGGSKDRVQRLVQDHLNGFFTVTVTSDDVENTKPYAEPYQKAAKLLDLEPDECLVIENAPLGIQSGKNAGMKVLAVQTTLNRKYLKQADYIVPDLIRAYEIILKIIHSNGKDS